MSQIPKGMEKELIAAADAVLEAHRNFMMVLIKAGAEEEDPEQSKGVTLAVAGYAAVFAPADMAVMKVKLEADKPQHDHNWVRIEKDNVTVCAVEGCKATKS